MMNNMKSFKQFIFEGISFPEVQDYASRIFKTKPMQKLIQSEEEYNGKDGNNSHGTMNQSAWIPLETLETLEGAMGEKREFDKKGNFGNYTAEEWKELLSDIKENGLKYPVTVFVKYRSKPVIHEGNHRIQALKQLGYKYIPCEIKYFGNAQNYLIFNESGKFQQRTDI